MRSTTLNSFHSRASSSKLSRVTPGKINPSSGGVTNSRSLRYHKIIHLKLHCFLVLLHNNNHLHSYSSWTQICSSSPPQSTDDLSHTTTELVGDLIILIVSVKIVTILPIYLTIPYQYLKSFFQQFYGRDIDVNRLVTNLNVNCRGIVGTHFHGATSSRPGSHILRICQKRNRFKTWGEIGADGTKKHIEQRLVRAGDSQRRLLK